MAITANMDWDFQTGGNDANGGGFDSTVASAGTDYSQVTTPQATLTVLSVVAAATSDITVSVTNYTVAATDIGNVFFLTGGTGTVDFYYIVSVNVGTNTWTMDHSPGATGVTCPGRMGGCRANPVSNSFLTKLVAGNKVHLKLGTFTLGAAWASQTAGTAVAPIQILGYQTAHNDNPTSTNRPTFTMAANAFTLGAATMLRNFIMTFSGATDLVMSSNGCTTENCKVTSTNATSTTIAINGSASGSKIINCEVIAASCIALRLSAGGTAFGNWVHGSTVGVKLTANSIRVLFNLVTGCTTALDMATTSLSDHTVAFNTFFGAATPAGTGIDGSVSVAPVRSSFMNNIFYGFTTGVNWNAAQAENWWAYNTFFNNTTARTNVTAGLGDIAVDPTFTNAAGNDWSVGTNMKAVGTPALFNGSSTTGATDIGAVQRVEAGGGTTYIYNLME